MKKNGFIGSAAAFVLKRNWWLVALLLMAIAASMFLQLIPAFVIRRIVDENFAKGMLDGIWLLAAWYLAASAGANIVEFVKVILTTVLGQKILNRLRLLMAQRLSELPMKYFLNTPTGDVMSRLTTDIDAINTLFSTGIVGVVADLFKIGGLLVSLYVMAPQLLWLEFAVVPVVFMLARYFSGNIFRYQKQVRERVADIYAFIQEWLRGIRTVKAYSLERSGEAKFRVPLNNHLSAISAISFYDSWFPCVMQTFRALVIAFSLWLCAKNGTVFSLGLSVGTLVAAVDLVGRLFAPLEALATEFQTIQQARAGIARVREFADEPVEDREYLDQPLDENRGVEIACVSFAYGHVDVLADIDVNLRPGEKTVFIGRSGAGKTTLMNLVSGLYRPKGGTVRICGIDPYTLPPRRRRRLIGVVPQMPQIFDGTVKENITLGDDTITQLEIEAAVADVGLGGIIAQLPQGYDTSIGEGAVGLSIGEVQLLSLARAIVANPRLLLLDEPTSGMDTRTEQRVLKAIRMAGQGRTILSISHRLGGVIDADSVHLMAGGRIMESGSAKELEKHGGWYAMYRKIEAAGWDFA